MAKVLTQATKVGIFVVVAGAAGFVIWRAVSKDIGSGGGYTVHAYLDDAAGLAAHSRVTESGIAVGEIGLGSSALGRSGFHAIPDDEALYFLGCALDMECSYIDTTISRRSSSPSIRISMRPAGIKSGNRSPHSINTTASSRSKISSNPSDCTSRVVSNR